MIESFIEAGNQPIPEDLSQLRYGCPVTDACVDWATTETMLRETHDLLKEPRSKPVPAETNQAKPTIIVNHYRTLLQVIRTHHDPRCTRSLHPMPLY